MGKTALRVTTADATCTVAPIAAVPGGFDDGDMAQLANQGVRDSRLSDEGDPMTTRVAINGFGRIGRAFLRSAIERNAALDVVAVHDVAGADVLAHLLERDSVYGRFAHPVRVEDGALVVAGRRVHVVEDEGRGPSWGDLGADVVIEASGRLRTRTDAARHIDAGARKVIVSAPIKGAEAADADLVLGVNFDEVYDPERHHIISNVSCTTNCLAPVAKVLHETVGIRHGLMTTIHAYTTDQQLLDAPHKDLRRARAAAINLVPTSTGAAEALGLVIPELEGRLNGFAVRVPVPTGSLVDLTVEVEQPTTAAEVNAAFAERATSGALAGILAYSEEPIVSSDIVKSPFSAILDAPLTTVIDGTQVKVVAWYDNEWGYANRLVELAERVLTRVPVTA
jgi:glyceraldehyde 3-phosphate dehydrogenase